MCAKQITKRERNKRNKKKKCSSKNVDIDELHRKCLEDWIEFHYFLQMRKHFQMNMEIMSKNPM